MSKEKNARTATEEAMKTENAVRIKSQWGCLFKTLSFKAEAGNKITGCPTHTEPNMLVVIRVVKYI